MGTAYVSTEIDVGCGVLYLDGNSKITAENGTFDDPVPNALSLPHISTCPGATNECMASCYVYGLQTEAPEIYKRYAQNERMIHRILMSEFSLGRASEMLAAWISVNCVKGGFRWHVSGDVMNERYARWIVSVANNSPSVRHWIYTRSLSLVPILTNFGCKTNGLVVNVSADADNYKAAFKVAQDNGIRLCYLCRDGKIPDDLPLGSVVFPDYELRGRDLDDPTTSPWWQAITQEQRRMVCPADFFGQSEQHRCGPCKKCLTK